MPCVTNKIGRIVISALCVITATDTVEHTKSDTFLCGVFLSFLPCLLLFPEVTFSERTKITAQVRFVLSKRKRILALKLK